MALPDNQHALSGSYDKTVKLFDVNDGAVLRTFTHHTNGVADHGLALMPDGLRFVSGSCDGTARIVEIGPLQRTAADEVRDEEAAARALGRARTWEQLEAAIAAAKEAKVAAATIQQAEERLPVVAADAMAEAEDSEKLEAAIAAAKKAKVADATIQQAEERLVMGKAQEAAVEEARRTLGAAQTAAELKAALATTVHASTPVCASARLQSHQFLIPSAPSTGGRARGERARPTP